MNFSKLLKNKIFLAVFLITLLGAFFRFYNFSNRWNPGEDEARDIMLAQQALLHHEIPLTGSFSSAGPFLFGPLFYWFIMGSIFFFPFSPVAPYIIEVLVSAATVVIFFFIGKRLEGNRLGLLTAFFAAISPQLVARAIVLGQHSFVAYFTALLLLFFILLWQTKKKLWAFLAGVSLGTAFSFHYQSINLLVMFPLVFFIPKESIRRKLVFIGIMILGFLIPTIPYLYWESMQSFANTRNILDYFLIGQYRLYVANSWKLFLFQFLPDYWKFVLGGTTFASSIIMLNTFFVIGWAFYKRKMPSVVGAFSCVFLFFLFLNRYYHGERSEGYLLYLNPFILVLSAWALSFWIKITPKTKKITVTNIWAILLFLVILRGNYDGLSNQLSLVGHAHFFADIAKTLENKYPGKKITMYDFQWKTPWAGYPISLFLSYDNKGSMSGLPIGVYTDEQKATLPHTFPTILHKDTLTFVRLDTADLKDKKSWTNMSGEWLYADFRTWNYYHRLTSIFSLTGYIETRLGLRK